MSDAVVVDTNVLSWLFDQRPNPLPDRYCSLIDERRVLVAFQSVMELRYGALHAGWGELRRRRLGRSLGALTVIQPDDALVNVCAELRHACDQAGHGLGGKAHDGDRWVAATALRRQVDSWRMTGFSSGPPAWSWSPPSDHDAALRRPIEAASRAMALAVATSGSHGNLGGNLRGNLNLITILGGNLRGNLGAPRLGASAPASPEVVASATARAGGSGPVAMGAPFSHQDGDAAHDEQERPARDISPAQARGGQATASSCSMPSPSTIALAQVITRSAVLATCSGSPPDHLAT
ncbi:MAG TPA: PIN domain-containing protein [Acidimicrobiales bacterium]|nr:PIN domain-containing protein [Acidimicrobiales bacterium]